jgi:translation initiation factor 3 subunit C
LQFVQIVPDDPNVIKVVGNIESFILRLEDEYTKSLQQINPHTQEYVTRLSDEATLVDLSEKIAAYFKRTDEFKSAAAVSLMIVEHLYYKHDSHAAAVHKAHLFNNRWGNYADLHPASMGKIVANPDTTETRQTLQHPASFNGNPTVEVVVYSAEKKMDELCNFIFKNGDERNKTRALLCSVYHHALHDRYYRARDMFLISHIQEFIEKAEVKTQILYNRAVATLGLCAFRMGLFQKAHDCLSGICTGRARELLAQGQMKVRCCCCVLWLWLVFLA